MGVGNTTNWAKNTVFRQVVEAGYVKTVYRNDKYMGFFGSTPSRGGTSYEWHVNSAANGSVEVHTEGGALTSPSSQTFVKAVLDYITFTGSTLVTNEIKRALASGVALDGFDVIAENLQLLFDDLRDLQATTWMGTSNNGLGIAVDSSGTYAAINRASATHWQSYEASIGGSIAHSDLMDTREALVDAERGGSPVMILCAPNQVTNIQNIPGAPGAANNSININLQQSGGTMQLAPTLNGTTFGEMMLVGMPDMTNTEIYALDTRGVFFVDHGGLEVIDSVSGIDSVTTLVVAGTLVVKNPRIEAKLTGVTA